MNSIFWKMEETKRGELIERLNDCTSIEVFINAIFICNK